MNDQKKEIKTFVVYKRVIVAYRYTVQAKNLKTLKADLENHLPIIEDGYQWEETLNAEIYTPEDAEKITSSPHDDQPIPLLTLEAKEFV